MAFDLPDNQVVINESRMVSAGWLQWFQYVQNVVLAAYSSGTTAQRPVKGLWVGRRYFDTSLGKPVYFKALGSPNVWVDGVGTVS